MDKMLLHQIKKLKRRWERGFSMIEVMIVLVIVAIIMALAMGWVRYAIDNAKQKVTIARIKTISVAVTAYRIDNNRFAPNPGGVGKDGTVDVLKPYLVPVYLTKTFPTTDGWGHSLYYRLVAEEIAEFDELGNDDLDFSDDFSSSEAAGAAAKEKKKRNGKKKGKRRGVRPAHAFECHKSVKEKIEQEDASFADDELQVSTDDEDADGRAAMPDVIPAPPIPDSREIHISFEASSFGLDGTPDDSSRAIGGPFTEDIVAYNGLFYGHF